jgi:nucleoid-associated protein YgaU
MKYGMFPLFAIGLVFLTGCAPKLAESPYGPVEDEWMRYVKGSYSSWRPPQTFPPARPGIEEEPSDAALPEDPAKLGEAALPSGTLPGQEILVIEEPVVVEPILFPEVVPAPSQSKAVAEPVIGPDPSGKVETYEVQKGDSLSLISHKFYGKANLWPKIADYNGITDPRKLKAGMKIKIPLEK